MLLEACFRIGVAHAVVQSRSRLERDIRSDNGYHRIGELFLVRVRLGDNPAGAKLCGMPGSFESCEIARAPITSRHLDKNVDVGMSGMDTREFLEGRIGVQPVRNSHLDGGDVNTRDGERVRECGRRIGWAGRHGQTQRHRAVR